MNKVFKIVWSAATQSWVVVSELSKAHKKQSAVKNVVVLATALAAGNAFAATVTDDFIKINSTGTAMATAAAADGVAIGNGAKSGADTKITNTIAIGKNAIAQADGSIAIGEYAHTEGSTADLSAVRSIAIGSNATIIPTRGATATNRVTNTIAIGSDAYASASRSIVIGHNAMSLRDPDNNTFQTAEDTVVIGSRAQNNWDKSVAIGPDARNNMTESVAIGFDAESTGNTGSNAASVAVGPHAKAMGTGSTAFGNTVQAHGSYSTAVGPQAFSYGNESTALGRNTITRGSNATAVGNTSNTGVNAERATAVGYTAHAAETSAVALGDNATAYTAGGTAIGRSSTTYGSHAIAIGSGRETKGTAGSNTFATGEGAAAMGNQAKSMGTGSLAFGTSAVAGGDKDTLAISTAAALAAYQTSYNTYVGVKDIELRATADYATAQTHMKTDAFDVYIVLKNLSDAQKTLLNDAGIDSTTLATLAGTKTSVDSMYITANGSAADAKKAMETNLEVLQKIAAITKTDAGQDNASLKLLVDKTTAAIGSYVEEATLLAAREAATEAATQAETALNTAKTTLQGVYGTAKANAVAIGTSANAQGKDSVSLGTSSVAVEESSFAMGTKAQSKSTNAVAIGRDAMVETGSNDSVAIGRSAKVNANSNGATAIGNEAQATGQYAYASGFRARATVAGATAIGNDAQATESQTVAVGTQARATGASDLAFGSGAKATGSFGTAVGVSSGASAVGAAAFGMNAQARATMSTALGPGADATVERGVALGNRSLANVEARQGFNPANQSASLAGVNSGADDVRLNGYAGLTDRVLTANTAAVSVGGAKVGDIVTSRQIINVAAGTADHDAVNVAQLRSVNLKLAGNTNGKTESVMADAQKATDATAELKAKADVLLDSQTLKVVGEAGSFITTDATNNTITAKVDYDRVPMVYTTQDGTKVYPVKDATTGNITFNTQPDGKGTTVNTTNNPIVVSLNNPTSGNTSTQTTSPTQLTNIAAGANTIAYDKDGTQLVKIGDNYYDQEDVVNGAPKAGAVAKTVATEAELNTIKTNDPAKAAKSGLADLDKSKDTNALTVADAKNLGWVVSTENADGKWAADVRNTNQVNFKGENGIKVSGETDANGVRNVTIELEKGSVISTDKDKKTGTITTGTGDNATKTNVVKADDGKWYPADQVTTKTDSNGNTQVTPNTGATPIEEKTVNINNSGSGFVTGNQVGDAIQQSGWTVGKAQQALADNKFTNADEKVNPNDNVRFADGKGITVKTATVDSKNDDGSKATTTVVKFDTDLPINYSKVTDGNNNELKQANNGKWYKADEVKTDGSLITEKDGKPFTPTEVTTVKKEGASLSDDNGSKETNPYRTAIEKAAIEKVLKENPNEKDPLKLIEKITEEVAALEKAEKTGADKDTIKEGTSGVKLDNVGWAENPDQAVNKDQLDQTVNKSGFFVQQNGKSTLATNPDETDATKSEKVTPNDVMNFKNGNGTTVKVETVRDKDTGVDTTTISVDVDLSKATFDRGEIKADTNTGRVTGPVTEKLEKDLTDAQKAKEDAAKAVTEAQNKVNEAQKEADAKPGDQTAAKALEDAQKALETAKETQTKADTAANTAQEAVDKAKNQVATAENVKDAINNSGWKGDVKASGTGKVDGTSTPTLVKPGTQVNYAAGDNMVIKQEVDKDTGDHTYTYSLNKDVNLKDGSVTITNENGDTTKIDGNGITITPKGNTDESKNVSVTKDGINAGSKVISNVAPGVKDTDAVNVSQLNQVKNDISNINNNNVRLENKVNRMNKDLRAGIAGANAAAGLPQVFTPGKSMVAASAGTFKGENALAVGYSRASDNGKVIFKMQGNANSRGDVGGSVGVGYQW